MKVALTGATGFIGRHLVKRLTEKKHAVRALSRQEISLKNKYVNFVKGDLSDGDFSLESFVEGADCICHCAGVLGNTPAVFESNVNATRRLLDAASGRIKHWVQISSAGVYGSQKDGIIDENTLVNPGSAYESSKAKADEAVIEKAHTGCFTYSILRPSNVYGNDMSNQSLFHMIKMINRGLFFFIGDKKAVANYIHVENVVRGIQLCLEKKEAGDQIFNLSDSAPLEKLVDIISESLDKSPPRFVIPRIIINCISGISYFWKKWPLTQSRIEALTSRAVYSNAKIEKYLKYEHKVSIESGFRELSKTWKAGIS